MKSSILSYENQEDNTTEDEESHRTVQNMVKENGCIYSGQLNCAISKGVETKVEHGKGTMTFPDGSKYVG